VILCATPTAPVGNALKRLYPTQELLFAEHHTAADLVIGDLFAPCEFANQTLANVEKLCRFGNFVEPFRVATSFPWSWLTLRLLCCAPCLCIEEVSLNRLQCRDEMPQDDGSCGCNTHSPLIATILHGSKCRVRLFQGSLHRECRVSKSGRRRK
jgi:hypothetical protein